MVVAVSEVISSRMSSLLSRIASWANQLHPQIGQIALANRTSCDAHKTRNAKGDWQERFDLAVHQIVLKKLQDEFASGVLISEEADPTSFGSQPPTFQFVVDPVDGSTNWKQGLPLSALCIAAFDVASPLSVDTVVWAVISDLSADEAPYVAVRGEGAWYRSSRLKIDGRSLERAIVNIELDHCVPDDRLAALMQNCGGVRSYCCTAVSIAWIAAGRLDAHIDIRRRVTPESYLASALILREAGGVIGDDNGNVLPPLSGLTDRRNIIAAGSSTLYDELVNILRH